MNTIQNYGMINYNKNNCVDYKFKQNNIAFTSKSIARVTTQKRGNILQNVLSFFGIKTNFDKQLIKQMEEKLKNTNLVRREHSSFRATANDFIFGNDTFMQRGMLNNSPIYKAGGHYIIQSFDNDGIAIFKKYNSKGKLVDTIMLTRNAL